LIDFSGFGIYIFHLLFSFAIANANETAQVAKRDGDAVAIAKADYYAEIAKDAFWSPRL
jgi:hypothetical protein